MGSTVPLASSTPRRNVGCRGAPVARQGLLRAAADVVKTLGWAGAEILVPPCL